MADKVAVEKSQRSAPEIVVPNWAYSSRIRKAQPRSEPLHYPTQQMPAPPQLLSISQYKPSAIAL